MMQKTVEFHVPVFAFLEQPLHNSCFLGVPLSLKASASVFLDKDIGRKWVWVFKSMDKTHSGLYEIDLELQFGKAVQRYLQTQAE